MSTIRYIKNLLPYSITLHTGHSINAAVIFEPYEVKLYTDYVEDNIDSINYNRYLFDEYVNDQLISIITTHIN